MLIFLHFQLWSLAHFPPSQIALALHCIALHCIALACLPLETPFPRSFVLSRRAREREREVGETFVCKTCRGRSIHPFQKNNITFKWRNSLEPPNPIFEPRSLSRTFPFWIFHSQQLWSGGRGWTSHWGFKPSVHSIRRWMQELPSSPLSPLHRCEKLSSIFQDFLRFQN